MASNTELTTAIEEAASQIQAEIDEKETSKKESTKEVETEEEETPEDGDPGDETDDTEETEEDTLSEAENEKQAQKEALTLYNALKDPKLRGPVLAALVQQAGLNLSPPETKAAEKKQEKAIKELVTETLGPEYKFLADKLGTVIEEVVGRIETQNNETRQQQVEQQILRETNETLAALAKETKGESKKIESKMVQLMDKFPSGPNTSVDEYIRGIYKMASGDRIASNTKIQVADKIRNNSRNAPERLRSTGGTDNGQVKQFQGKGALNKSVNFALEQLAKQGNK